MELFVLYFNLLLFYIKLSIGFWITRILKKENLKIESFPLSTDLALDIIYIYIYILDMYIYLIPSLNCRMINVLQKTPWNPYNYIIALS